jgi:hypothetical protein
MPRRPKIPDKTVIKLWTLYGGRCGYEGCNKALWQDDLTLAQMNRAYIAHIYGVNPGSARYDSVKSSQLATDITNLMLMCDKHHRLIDHEGKNDHPASRLKAMKRNHEERIKLLTSIQPDKKSHIILYEANIGQQSPMVNWDKAAIAMIPNHYPAEKPAIELGVWNSSFRDHEDVYWDNEREQLNRKFNEIIKPRLRNMPHLSIFAIAPQPLLIELGRLFSDIPAADVYQLHREPPDWIWQEHPEGFEYLVSGPKNKSNIVALNLSLSATIDNNRIKEVIGPETSIWTVSIDRPNNDFLKSREQLLLFRQTFRRLMDEIKSSHGQNTILHVFPAVPVSIAVEIGRCWMSKADVPMIIYDQCRNNGGFNKVLEIKP